MSTALSNRTMQEKFSDVVRRAARTLVSEGLLPGESLDRTLTVEKPRDPEHGDLATNAALVLAGDARCAPRQLAEHFSRVMRPDIESDAHFCSLEIAGPGFINLRLSDQYLQELLRAILETESYGVWQRGGGRRVLVEFVSANPTGPLVVVQARSAALGDVIVRLLRRIGYDAHSEYYVNDAGGQLQKLGLSMEARVRELMGEEVTLPEGAYPGEYVRDLAGLYLQARGSEEMSRDALGRFAAEELVKQHRELLRRYGVEFDRWYRESEVRASGGPERVLRLLRERGHLYDSQGAVWLRSTTFGDDKDRVLVKGDGSYTYLLPDLAYHLNKLERGYDWLIDILGPDHHGYVARMQAGLCALGYPEDALYVLISQWVRLLSGGEEMSMSKRAGTFVSMEELLDEVGADAARFFFVMRSPSSPLDFDLDLAKSQSAENPVFYAQYAHARISGIMDEARRRGVETDAPPEHLDLLEHPREQQLVRLLGDFPGEVLQAAEGLEPQRIASYVLDLAAAFHIFYTECRILNADACMTRARLSLAGACRKVLASALDLLGVAAPDQM
ncbi:MAG: arginine--tRNA ligase [Bacillota bacterium]